MALYQRFWHALGITSPNAATVSINTLTNFRGRLVAYERETGTDLLAEELKALSHGLANCIGLNKKMVRMDSFMVSSSCRELTRLELVFSVLQDAVQALAKQDKAAVPESYAPFLEAKYVKEAVHRLSDNEVPDQLRLFLRMAAELLKLVQQREGWEKVKPFALLARMVPEQTKVDEQGQTTPKDSKEASQ